MREGRGSGVVEFAANAITRPEHHVPESPVVVQGETCRPHGTVRNLVLDYKDTISRYFANFYQLLHKLVLWNGPVGAVHPGTWRGSVIMTTEEYCKLSPVVMNSQWHRELT